MGQAGKSTSLLQSAHTNYKNAVWTLPCFTAGTRQSPYGIGKISSRIGHWSACQIFLPANWLVCLKMSKGNVINKKNQLFTLLPWSPQFLTKQQFVPMPANCSMPLKVPVLAYRFTLQTLKRWNIRGAVNTYWPWAPDKLLPRAKTVCQFAA